MNQTVRETVPEIVEILAAHLKKYPLMQPRDVVKLLYQNEFGAARFSGTEEESFEAIREELDDVEYNESETLYESIGNGLVRVNFAALDEKEYPVSRLNEDFLSGAKEVQGTAEGIEAKIEDVLLYFEDLPFDFPKEDLERFLERWREMDRPAVVHSNEYRDLYEPHYRLIRAKYMHDFTEERRLKEPKSRRVVRFIVIGVILALTAVGMAILGNYLYKMLAL